MWRFVETRTLFAAATGMLTGLCWLFTRAQLPSVVEFGFLFGACAVAVVILQRAPCRRWCQIRTNSAVLTALVLGLVTGITLGSFEASRRLGERLDPALHSSDIELSGTITGLVQQDAVRTSFVLDDVRAIDPGVDLPRRIRVAWYGPTTQLHSGERWQLIVRLKPIRGTLNPGGFDAQRWALGFNVGARGYVRQAQRAKLLQRHTVWNIDSHRAAIAKSLTGVSSRAEVNGVLAALAVGDRSALSQAQWQTFRDTGTSHLIAISGLHVGFVAMLIGGLAIWLARVVVVPCRYIPARIPGVVCGVAAAGGYAALAGFSVPTQRALIMVIVMSIALMARSRVNLVRSVSIALILVLLLNPLTPLSFGLWLSFGAVLTIAVISASSFRLGVAISSSFEKTFIARTQFALSTWFRLQLAMSLSLLPVGLMLFGEASICSVVANAIAIPVTTFVIVPTLLLGLCVKLASDPLSWLLLKVSAVSVEGMLTYLEFLAQQPMATLNRPTPPLWIVVLCVISTGVLVVGRLVPLAWLTLLWWLPLFLPRQATVDDALRVTMLDVGQGLAVVAQTGNRTLVFDTGRGGRGSDDGARVLAPFLKSAGVVHIDTLVVSHSDHDHAGGSRSLLQDFKSAQVFTGWKSSIPDARVCDPANDWKWGNVSFDMLGPLDQSGRSRNDRSCVLRIGSPWGSVLLTGDIEVAGEGALVKAYGHDLRSDILVVPHHGAKTSSTVPFVARVQPAYAAISAGYRNRFGHPDPGVVERYVAAGTRVVTTAESGAVTFELSSAGIAQSRYRETARRFWHRP